MDPYKIFEEIKSKINLLYPNLGVNKKREIERLLFEIARIDNDKYLKFFDKKFNDYISLKKELLKTRYPFSYKKYPLEKFYLPNLELDKEKEVIIKKEKLNPKIIYFEKDAKESKLLNNFKKKFTEAKFIEINSIKELKSLPNNYSKRKENFILMKEKFDFNKNCPCTKGCISCGYFVMNLGFGCPFDCTYCYLQGYQNLNALILPYNLKDFFLDFDKKFSSLKKKIRIGSGEFTDSLVFDEITEFSTEIVDFFSKKENVYFEFKTKSISIGNLLKLKPSKNIVISYSLNPEIIAEKEEIFSSSIKERLNALKNLYDYGYSVAFHFDPIISFKNWKEEYENLIKEINSYISLSNFKWVSLGTFRFKPETKKIIEKRFPYSDILLEEMILDFDGKLRYPFEKRKEIYEYIVKELNEFGLDKNKMYFCMEEKAMWDFIGLNKSFSW